MMESPLHAASRKGHTDAFIYLLAAGADVEVLSTVRYNVMAKDLS